MSEEISTWSSVETSSESSALGSRVHEVRKATTLVIVERGGVPEAPDPRRLEGGPGCDAGDRSLVERVEGEVRRRAPGRLPHPGAGDRRSGVSVCTLGTDDHSGPGAERATLDERA